MFRLDPEIAVAFESFAGAATLLNPPAPGDVLALRAYTDVALGAVFDGLADAPDVIASSHATHSADGGQVGLTWYEKHGAPRGPAVVYVHGGGMVCGSTTHYDRLVRFYVQLAGVPFLSVSYRLAPEHNHNGLGRDVLAAMRWLVAEAAGLGVDPGRISVMGDSGGGGVAAAAAIMARDLGIELASQILIYPMLDDRNVVPDPLLVPTAIWSYDGNRTAWTAVVGGEPGLPGVSPWLAPARLTDFAGLAPAYIEVGELDIFRDESIVYAQKLLAAGVSCELHLHPGAPHGHDWASLNSGISKRVIAERARILGAL